MPWLGVTRVLHAGVSVRVALPKGLNGGVQHVDFRAEREVELSLQRVATENQEVGAQAELRHKGDGAGVKQQGEQGRQGFVDQGVFAGVEQVGEGVRTRVMLPGERGSDIPGAGQVGDEGMQDSLIEGVELCREFTVGN